MESSNAPETSVKDVIKGTGFRFNKALGQNFITDVNLLRAISADSGAKADDTVVEIGTGAGTLTRELAAVAKKVYSFEVDRNLEPVLALSLKGLDNVEVVFRDVLKMKDEEFSQLVGGSFKVVANLPYYITTPLIMRFLESALKVESITVMVQREVADRLVALPSTANYSAITLAVNSAGGASVTRDVSRKMFFPQPNVDSAVVKIDVDRSVLDGEDAPLVHKLVRAAFSMRRKTLANNLAPAFGLSKSEACEKIVSAGFEPLIRGEKLSLNDFIVLSHSFKA